MRETEALLRLQEIDLELMKNKATLASMPQTKKIEAVKAAKKKLASDYKHVVGQLKDCRMELDELDEKIMECEDKTARVKGDFAAGGNYRSVKDAEAHLTALAKNEEKLKFRRLDVDKERQRLEHAVKGAHELDDRLTAEGKALIKAFQDESHQIQTSIEILMHERAYCLRHISPEIQEKYAQASKRFKGLAVERLRGNVPSTCRVKLQPAAYGDLKRGAAITECPYCHRLLITEGATNVEE
ncbi:MAG: zinc ribbon domain-containing protein [Atopobiaceae bacterium]|jgi:predicted  nucleic acid-binding Zn-ribbon protein